MGRTLYLKETRSNGLRVLRDGPSVLIAAREKANRRVPVRLISRVVVMGNVRLDASAITLFAENDIPVVLLNPASEEVAVVIPYNHKLPSHYEEQKIFLSSRENIRYFETWVDAKRTVIQVNVLSRLLRSFAGRLRYGIGEGNYRELLSRMKPASEEKWTVAMGMVTNLFRGLIIEPLMRADLDPHLGILHRRHNFGLALDVCYIMGAESDAQCLQFFRRAKKNSYMKRRGNAWIITDAGVRDIVQRFENRKSVLENMIDQIIDELFELMREIGSGSKAEISSFRKQQAQG